MSISPPLQTKPPRLLTGVAFVFWGAMSDHAVIGLICAILVEACHWINVRFDLKSSSYVRAWQLSVGLFIFVIFYKWMKVSASELVSALVWLPVCFLPLELTQRYGREVQMPITTFSFIARFHQRRDREKGKTIREKYISFSFPFIAILLISTSFSSKPDWPHFVGFCLLLFTSLMAVTKGLKRNPVLFVLVACMAIIPAYFGQYNLKKLSEFLREVRGSEKAQIDARASRTSIGWVGEKNLSNEIYWRMTAEEGYVPRLLRSASYNSYGDLDTHSASKYHGNWKCETGLQGINASDAFDSLVVGGALDPFLYFKFDESIDFKTLNEATSVKVKGAVKTVSVIPMTDQPFALGGLSQRLKELKAAGLEGSDVEFNPLGTVQITNPGLAAIEYEVVLRNNNVSETIPSELDTEVPQLEQKAINIFIQQHGLNTLNQEALVRKLREIFISEFEYSLTTERERLPSEGTLEPFLLETKKGHCEYYATATALILRQLKIPTRYSVGYSVQEYDQRAKEWILRGTHAHAWCRAYLGGRQVGKQWVDGKWVDLDLTPPDFNEHLNRPLTPEERFRDWLQRIREDLAVWRAKEGSALQLGVILGGGALLMIGYILFRIRKSLRRLEGVKNKKDVKLVFKHTPLTVLNKKLDRYLKPRPVGMAYVDWLEALVKIDPKLEMLVDDLKRNYNSYRFDDRQAELVEDAHFEGLVRQLKEWMKDNPPNKIKY